MIILFVNLRVLRASSLMSCVTIFVFFCSRFKFSFCPVAISFSLVSISFSLSAKFHLDPADNRCSPFLSHFFADSNFPPTSAFSSRLIILSLSFPSPPFSPNPFNPLN